MTEAEFEERRHEFEALDREADPKRQRAAPPQKSWRGYHAKVDTLEDSTPASAAKGTGPDAGGAVGADGDHKRFACAHCGRAFARERGLKIHVKRYCIAAGAPGSDEMVDALWAQELPPRIERALGLFSPAELRAAFDLVQPRCAKDDRERRQNARLCFDTLAVIWSGHFHMRERAKMKLDQRIVALSEEREKTKNYLEANAFFVQMSLCAMQRRELQAAIDTENRASKVFMLYPLALTLEHGAALASLEGDAMRLLSAWDVSAVLKIVRRFLRTTVESGRLAAMKQAVAHKDTDALCGACGVPGYAFRGAQSGAPKRGGGPGGLFVTHALFQGGAVLAGGPAAQEGAPAACPWCRKLFQKERGLRHHMRRWCAKVPNGLTAAEARAQEDAAIAAGRLGSPKGARKRRRQADAAYKDEWAWMNGVKKAVERRRRPGKWPSLAEYAMMVDCRFMFPGKRDTIHRVLAVRWSTERQEVVAYYCSRHNLEAVRRSARREAWEAWGAAADEHTRRRVLREMEESADRWYAGESAVGTKWACCARCTKWRRLCKLGSIEEEANADCWRMGYACGDPQEELGSDEEDEPDEPGEQDGGDGRGESAGGGAGKGEEGTPTEREEQGAEEEKVEAVDEEEERKREEERRRLREERARERDAATCSYPDPRSLLPPSEGRRGRRGRSKASAKGSVKIVYGVAGNDDPADYYVRTAPAYNVYHSMLISAHRLAKSGL